MEGAVLCWPSKVPVQKTLNTTCATLEVNMFGTPSDRAVPNRADASSGRTDFYATKYTSKRKFWRPSVKREAEEQPRSCLYHEHAFTHFLAQQMPRAKSRAVSY